VLSRRERRDERRTARRDGHSSRPRPAASNRPLRRSPPPRHCPPSKNRQAPKRACFRCQACDHLVADCRDPVRCASCRRWGHRARGCSSIAPATPTRQAPTPPARAPSSTTMAFLGAPATRPEEDTCFLATSFDLDRARLEWEATTLVAWVISPPPGTDRVAVTAAFRRKFRLHSDEFMVSKHYPEEQARACCCTICADCTGPHNFGGPIFYIGLL
jgi:hypothetical protein